MNHPNDTFIVIANGYNWTYKTYLPALNKFTKLNEMNIRCGLYKQVGVTSSVLVRIK